MLFLGGSEPNVYEKWWCIPLQLYNCIITELFLRVVSFQVLLSPELERRLSFNPKPMVDTRTNHNRTTKMREEVSIVNGQSRAPMDHKDWQCVRIQYATWKTVGGSRVSGPIFSESARNAIFVFMFQPQPKSNMYKYKHVIPSFLFLFFSLLYPFPVIVDMWWVTPVEEMFRKIFVLTSV